ncbi:MAG: isopentenyl-diphosphate Delta-isomerase [Luteibaculum sp.]
MQEKQAVDWVVLVDQQDRELGVMEKMEAHEKGLLHRAFSVFLFNSQGEMLIQKRALDKYHSAGLWTNACCSHPRPGEDLEEAAHRRLTEEMGIHGLSLKHKFSFYYQSAYDNGLSEHELDHVYFGLFNGEPLLNPHEACDWKFISISELLVDLEKNPSDYTTWFGISMPRVLEHLEQNKVL